MKALVLSGGGAKGAYQVGAIRALIMQGGNEYDAYCGVSVGALNSSFLAMYDNGIEGLAIQELTDLWNDIDNSKIWKSWKPFGMLQGIFRDSLLNQQPLIDLVHEGLDPKALKNSGKLLRVGAVSLTTGEYRVFDEKYEHIQDAVLASSSFPVFFKPIEFEGQKWTDGGVRELTPLKSAIDLGATEIDIILTGKEGMGEKSFENSNALEIAKRAVSIQGEEISVGDLRQARLINQLVSIGELPDKKYLEIRVIRPDSGLTDDSLDFDPKKIQNMMNRGYQDAIKVLEEER